MHYLHSKNLLLKNQYGFTPQKCTVDAIMAVKENIDTGLKDGNCVVLLSLDVKGAFDAAWWPGILNALKEFRCPKNLYNLSKNYFSGRTAVLSTNNITLERHVSRGCPQGSCCGPGFWNIQYNSLLGLDFARHSNVIAFADDVIVVIKGKSVIEAENYANIEIQKITEWAKNNKISFNEQKSKVLIISKKRWESRKHISIYLNNKKLEQVNTLKYLGIIFDTKFTFNDHIDNVVTRCTKLINILSKAAKISWGLTGEAMKIIYKGAILPLLSYGAPVLKDALVRKNNQRKYKRVQRLVLIKIAKAFRTTSYEALCVLTALTPILIKIEEITDVYRTTKVMGNSHQAFDAMVELNKWPHPADIVKITGRDKKIDYLVEAYTDGSKSENGVGAGVALYVKKQLVQELKYKLDKRCSNNQAEQFAILRALQNIIDMKDVEIDHRKAVLYTDSMITLDSLRNTDKHHKLIEEIRNVIRSLEGDNWCVHFSWIKAHVGNHGNELADQLAKEAALNTEIPSSFDLIPKSAVITEAGYRSTEKWENEWANSTNGAQTKLFFPTIKQRIVVNIPMLHKLTAILTGHGKLKSYFYRFKISDDQMCSCKSGEQTVRHLLYECKILHKERTAFRRSIAMCGGVWPMQEKDMITKKHIKAFLIFVNSINFDLL